MLPLDPALFPIVLRLPSENVAAARAVLRPWIENRTLARAEVLKIPALAGRTRSVGRMRVHAVRVIGCLTVRENVLRIDAEPKPIGEGGGRHRERFDLRSGRRLGSELFGRRPDTAEDGSADAPAVAQIGRGKHIVEYTVPDDIDAAVCVDLDVVVGEELSVVSCRPVEVELSLLLVTWDICQYKNKPQICSPGAYTQTSNFKF